MTIRRALTVDHARVADVGPLVTLTVDRHAPQTAIGFASRERVVTLDEILLTFATTAAAACHRRTAFAMFGFRTRIAPMAQRETFAVDVQRRRFATRSRTTQTFDGALGLEFLTIMSRQFGATRIDRGAGSTRF